MKQRLKMEQKLKPSAPISRRTVVGGSIAAAAALAMPWVSRAKAAAFDGQEIRVLTWSDATGQAAVRNILKPFEQATGARIIADLTGTTSDMIAKIKASAARPQYDVVILSGFGANALADAGLLAKPDLMKIPNIEQVEEKYRLGASGHGVGYFLWSDGLLYNTKTYSAPPKSYGVLWDESNDGKIFVPQAKNLAAMELVIVATKLAGGDAFSNPEPGFKILGELKDRLLTISTNPNQLADLFRSNSLNAGGVYSPLVVPKFIRDSAYNLSGTYDLEEGFFVDLQYMVTPKNNPGSSDVVHAFYDFALSADVQGKMAEEVWYGPVNQSAVLSETAKNDPNVPSPELVKKRVIEVDSKYLASVREDWIKRYTAAVGG